MSDEPIKPLTPEEREAVREEAAQRILETAGELVALLNKRKPGEGPSQAAAPQPPSPVGPEVLLQQVLDRRLQAEASLLEELIEIVLPEAHLMARPLRDALSSSEEQDPAPLEALFGVLSARHRHAEWLDHPAVLLASDQTLPGAHSDAREGDMGALTLRQHWLLMDGRLIETQVIGTWSLRERMFKITGKALVGTRVVPPRDVVRSAGLESPISYLRLLLHNDYKVLEGRHVPDLAERGARFDALLSDYVKFLDTQVEALKRLGDSPA